MEDGTGGTGGGKGGRKIGSKGGGGGKGNRIKVRHNLLRVSLVDISEKSDIFTPPQFLHQVCFRVTRYPISIPSSPISILSSPISILSSPMSILSSESIPSKCPYRL